jgi:hypothetical protein
MTYSLNSSYSVLFLHSTYNLHPWGNLADKGALILSQIYHPKDYYCLATPIITANLKHN